MTISIQGIKGAFHEEAANNYYGREISILPNNTFPGLIESIQLGKSVAGVIAVENTISGTIHSNLNLIRESGLQIAGEIYLHIQQNLVALPGTRITHLTEVHSHYMAINQCRKFFRQYPHIKLQESEDTALSMREISNNKSKNIGAIGSKIGAAHYNLEILAESIETNKKNYTRFLVVEKPGINSNTEFNKASICLTLPNEKGSLAKILSIIAFYDIDLSKIESVPIIGEPWHYMFYIDLQIANTESYYGMFQAIKPLTDQLIIMGEYLSGDNSLKEIHNKL
ncbi:MAG: prephenate dehydratase [Chlorobi bacterium]|nr:prephenate dehydratase [Chlorobiota bacterium]